MSWLESLFQTYENNYGKTAYGDPAILLPVFHVTQQAHLIVRIDAAGKFKGAEIIADKNDRRTVIPCTEESAGRTSGQDPHPLFDSLQYVCGDFITHGGELKKQDQPYQAYLRLLRQWCASPFAHPKVQAVLTYLERATLAADLIAAGLLPVDGDGKLIMDKTKAPDSLLLKVVTGDLSKALVLFEYCAPGELHGELWEDDSVRRSWISYQLDQAAKGPQAICQVTGKNAPPARLHPRKIRNAGDGAKLISSNDTTNFTFLGRFENAVQAGCVSLEVSQKAHAALRWLIEKQGYHSDSLSVVAWALGSQVGVPQPARRTDNFLAEGFSLLGEADSATPDGLDIGTAEASGRALKRMIAGYKQKIHPESMMVMMLDSATPGTIAVEYYQELPGTELLERLQHWHEECAWEQHFDKERVFYGAPNPRAIVQAGYGRNCDDKLRRRLELTLLECILEKRRIPRQIYESVCRRVTNLGLDPGEFNQNLGIACALYRYFNPQEDCTMALSRIRNDRDYLYGRLLAVADKLEASALWTPDQGQPRPTNAMNLRAHFVKYPSQTYADLLDRLDPYKKRLLKDKQALLNKLERETDDIFHLFQEGDFELHAPLGPAWIPGFHSERAALWEKVSGAATAQSATDDATPDNANDNESLN